MSKSKMIKYKCMIGSKQLAPHVPETRWMTPGNVWGLLAKNGQVILKPLGGSRGAGVILVSSIRGDRYEIHSENKKKIFHEKKQTYNYVKTKTGTREYIVQRRIPLATINKRPFDIRVIVQCKRRSSFWKVTGRIAKVAGKGYIITNITRSKGTLLPIQTAIRKSSIRKRSVPVLLSNINKIALLTANRLRKIYPLHRIYGMDIGLDRNGHVWIIEANRKPLMSHFMKLKDKTMYRRIMEYKRL
ncbi:YheC/YheD family protein [Paenibacillus elgii]